MQLDIKMFEQSAKIWISLANLRNFGMQNKQVTIITFFPTGSFCCNIWVQCFYCVLGSLWFFMISFPWTPISTSTENYCSFACVLWSWRTFCSSKFCSKSQKKCTKICLFENYLVLYFRIGIYPEMNFKFNHWALFEVFASHDHQESSYFDGQV